MNIGQWLANAGNTLTDYSNEYLELTQRILRIKIINGVLIFIAIILGLCAIITACTYVSRSRKLEEYKSIIGTQKLELKKLAKRITKRQKKNEDVDELQDECDDLQDKLDYMLTEYINIKQSQNILILRCIIFIFICVFCFVIKIYITNTFLSKELTYMQELINSSFNTQNHPQNVPDISSVENQNESNNNANDFVPLDEWSTNSDQSNVNNSELAPSNDISTGVFAPNENEEDTSQTYDWLVDPNYYNN